MDSNFATYDDDIDSFDGGASVASSDWANLSSGSSTADDLLSAEDVAGSRELWDVWSSDQRIRSVTPDNVKMDDNTSRIIAGVFKLSCHIPYLWSYIQPVMHGHCTEFLQECLVNIAKHNIGLLDGEDVCPPMDQSHALTLAATALEVHHAALRLAQAESTDDQWVTEIHNPLILGCAQGRLLSTTRLWDPSLKLPVLLSDARSHPAIEHLWSVHSIRPHGGIAILSQDEEYLTGALFAAAFSTRSQIACQIRDMPEQQAQHAFSNMATSAMLLSLVELGLEVPVFGVMFDRNIVRIHVDWPAVLPESLDNGTLSLPLPHTDGRPEFRELDLTRPDDALRVVFILDAINRYARDVLAPAVRTSVMGRANARMSLEQALGEITSGEKVKAWMDFGESDGVPLGLKNFA